MELEELIKQREYTKQIAADFLYPGDAFGKLIAAKYLANNEFGGLLDKRGEAFVEHLRSVAEALPLHEQHDGWLHDFVEDLRAKPGEDPRSGWSFRDLLDIGYNRDDVRVLEADTKLFKGEPRFDFAVRIGKTDEDIRPRVIRVRLADIDNNSLPERLTHLSPPAADELREAYGYMRGYLVDIDRRIESGTPFQDWVRTLPRSKQNWELVRKNTAASLLEFEGTPTIRMVPGLVPA
jgi:hypothetical protein